MTPPRPALREALAARRSRDTPAVTALVHSARLWTQAADLGTHEGLHAARTRRQFRGRGPKMHPTQERFVVESYLAGRLGSGEMGEMGELLGASRSTVYRALRRAERAATEGRSTRA